MGSVLEMQHHLGDPDAIGRQDVGRLWPGLIRSEQQPMGNQSIAIDPPYFQQIFIGLARNDTALISGEFLVPRASQTHPY